MIEARVSHMARKSPKQKKQNKTNKQKPKQVVRTVVVPQMSIGAQIGDKLQKFAESTFARLLGRGDYTLQDNVGDIKKNALFTDTPKKALRFGGNNAFVVIEHSEFIGNIISSSEVGEFKTDVFPCDPTNPTTFPWLNQIAGNFEQYEIEGIVFRVESLSGTAISGTDSSLGAMSSAFLYDPTTGIPSNKQQLLQTYGSNTSVISKSQLIGVECAKESQVFDKLYIREQDAKSEERFYSKGNLVIATSGLKQASQTVAELWVHYRIKLLFPRQQVVNMDETDILYVASTFTDRNAVLPTATARFYSSSLSIEPGVNLNRVWINGLSENQHYLVESEWTATVTTTSNAATPQLAGAVTEVQAPIASATGINIGTGSYRTYGVYKVTGTGTNTVYLNADVLGGSGAIAGTVFIRVYPLVNWSGPDWSASQELSYK